MDTMGEEARGAGAGARAGVVAWEVRPEAAETVARRLEDKEAAARVGVQTVVAMTVNAVVEG